MVLNGNKNKRTHKIIKQNNQCRGPEHLPGDDAADRAERDAAAGHETARRQARHLQPAADQTRERSPSFLRHLFIGRA